MWRRSVRVRNWNVGSVLDARSSILWRIHLHSDPFSMTPRRALESIAGELQRQYERWQSKARYKSSLDPTQEDIKKLCVTLRRNARVTVVHARCALTVRSRSFRKNVFSFITMGTAFLVRQRTGRSGCSTRTSLNIFPCLSTTCRSGWVRLRSMSSIVRMPAWFSICSWNSLIPSKKN